MPLLELYGFRPELFAFPDSGPSSEFSASPLHPARVVFQSGEIVRVLTDDGERLAYPSGRLLDRSGPPVVGDWLLVAPMTPGESVVAERIVPRRGVLSRLAAGRESREQAIAANVDAVLVLAPAPAFPNARRIERGIAWAAACGIPAIVGVGKIDLVPDCSPLLAEAERSSAGAPVVAYSATTGAGVDELLALVPPGNTLALAGPSGAGKSTLLNRLLGRELEPTAEVRSSDGRGRHTTTWRRLVRLDSGQLLVDTPGYRELALWEAGPGLGEAFPEIDAAAGRCRFRDCRHESEPGCAVRQEIAEGRIDPSRFANLRKLEKEAAALERRRDPEAAREERNRWKQIHRDLRAKNRERW